MTGKGIEAGPLGGGSGAAGTAAGGGIDVPKVSESVERGRGGSCIEDKDARRPLLTEVAPKEERLSEVAMA